MAKPDRNEQRKAEAKCDSKIGLQIHMPAMASSAASSKATSSFDLSTLFVADKDARKQAAELLASQSKNEPVEFFGAIGLPEALVKVSCVGRRIAFLDRSSLTSMLLESGSWRQEEARGP